MTSPAPVLHTASLSWQVPTGKVISYSMYRSTIKGRSYGMRGELHRWDFFVLIRPRNGTRITTLLCRNRGLTVKSEEGKHSTNST